MHHLYEFVQSIFSLMFTMIRQNQTLTKGQQQQYSSQKNTFHNSTGTQTVEQFASNDLKKLPTVIIPTWTPQSQLRRPQKRACMQIQIFQKNIYEMDPNERRRALMQMKQSIQEQDMVQVDNKKDDQDRILKLFQPNIEKVIYSQSNESIRLAIDTLKQSDTSTHIFLSRFAGEIGQMNEDILQPEKLINKQTIQSIAKAVGTYKLLKMNSKDKSKLYNHVVEQVVYPLQYRISLNGRSARRRASEGVTESDDKGMPVIYQTRNLLIKRNQLPSLKLSVINDPMSHSSISSKTSINSKKEIKDANQQQKQTTFKQRPKERSSLSSNNVPANGIAVVGDNKSAVIFSNNAVSKSINLQYFNKSNSKQPLSKIIMRKQPANYSLSSKTKITKQLIDKQISYATSPKSSKGLQYNNKLRKTRMKTSTSYFADNLSKSNAKLNTIQSTTY